MAAVVVSCQQLVWVCSVAESMLALQRESCKVLWACCGESHFPSVLDLLGGALGGSRLCCCHLPKLQGQGEITLNCLEVRRG